MFIRHSLDSHTQRVDRPTLLKKRPASDDLRHNRLNKPSLGLGLAHQYAAGLAQRSHSWRVEPFLPDAGQQEQQDLHALSGFGEDAEPSPA